MPIAICKTCNRFTNSTTSNYWFAKDHIPTECYVAWNDEGKPEKGCGYNDLNLNDKYSGKEFYDKIIERGGLNVIQKSEITQKLRKEKFRKNEKMVEK